MQKSTRIAEISTTLTKITEVTFYVHPVQCIICTRDSPNFAKILPCKMSHTENLYTEHVEGQDHKIITSYKRQ